MLKSETSTSKDLIVGLRGGLLDLISYVECELFHRRNQPWEPQW